MTKPVFPTLTNRGLDGPIPCGACGRTIGRAFSVSGGRGVVSIPCKRCGHYTPIDLEKLSEAVACIT